MFCYFLSKHKKPVYKLLTQLLYLEILSNAADTFHTSGKAIAPGVWDNNLYVHYMLTLTMWLQEFSNILIFTLCWTTEYNLIQHKTVPLIIQINRRGHISVTKFCLNNYTWKESRKIMLSITSLFLLWWVDLDQLPAAHPGALSPLPLNMTVSVGKHNDKTPGPR